MSLFLDFGMKNGLEMSDSVLITVMSVLLNICCQEFELLMDNSCEQYAEHLRMQLHTEEEIVDEEPQKMKIKPSKNDDRHMSHGSMGSTNISSSELSLKEHKQEIIRMLYMSNRSDLFPVFGELLNLVGSMEVDHMDGFMWRQIMCECEFMFSGSNESPLRKKPLLYPTEVDVILGKCVEQNIPPNPQLFLINKIISTMCKNSVDNGLFLLGLLLSGENKFSKIYRSSTLPRSIDIQNWCEIQSTLNSLDRKGGSSDISPIQSILSIPWILSR